MSILYVGADVHANTTSFHVLDEKGEFVRESVERTNAESILKFVSGLGGTVHIAFEEGTQAHWLHGLLRSRVGKVVVCDPAKSSRLLAKKPNDARDAQGLAGLLKAGLLSPVFHDFDHVLNLKEIVRTHHNSVSDKTRTKNRLKAIFRGRGLPSQGRSIYAAEGREERLSTLPQAGLRFRARQLYVQLDVLDALVEESSEAIRKEVKNYSVHRLLETVPGIGPVRSATLLSYMVTPYRFPTRQAFWSYCGLGLTTRSSGNYEVVKEQLRWRPKSVQTRGLGRKRNAFLKHAIKGAAITAISTDPQFGELMERLTARGLSDNVARVNVARKIATIVLTVWKKGEKYDPTKMNSINTA